MNEGAYNLTDSDWAEAVRLWERTDVPEGSRAEIIEGIVTVSLPPLVSHHVIVGSIQRRLYSVIPQDREIFQTQAIAVPSRHGMLMPDLVVMPVQKHPEADAYVSAESAELVVEVTSYFTARHDRVSKPAAYAAAGIPLYLLVDRWADGGPTIILYGEPQNDVYRVLKAGKFGDPIDLPEPFNLTVDTSDFPHR